MARFQVFMPILSAATANVEFEGTIEEFEEALYKGDIEMKLNYDNSYAVIVSDKFDIMNIWEQSEVPFEIEIEQE